MMPQFSGAERRHTTQVERVANSLLHLQYSGAADRDVASVAPLPNLRTTLHVGKNYYPLRSVLTRVQCSKDLNGLTDFRPGRGRPLQMCDRLAHEQPACKDTARICQLVGIGGCTESQHFVRVNDRRFVLPGLE